MSAAMSSEKQNRLRVMVAFALVYVIWGSTYLAIRVLVSQVPSLVMGSLRFIPAGVIMLALCLAMRKRIAISRRDFAILAAVGILLLSGGNVVVGWAEEVLPSGVAALIAAVVPIWVAIIEAWVLRIERLSRLGIAGLALGTSGIVVLLWPQLTASSTLGHRELIAAAGLLCASLSWSAGSVFSRHGKLTVDPFVATAWEMFLAGVFNTVLALGAGSFAHAHWTRTAFAALAYLITGGSLIGFTAYIWLLEHVPTAKVATYAYVNPVVAVLLGWLVLHEAVNGYVLAGTLVIVCGVVLVTQAKVKSKLQAKEPLCAAPVYEGTD